MARVTHVKAARQRYATVPVIDPATGEQKVTPLLRKDGTPKVTKHGRPVVMRVTESDKSQPLPPRRCEKCGNDIAVGTPYKWIKPKSGPYGGHKRYRCATCPTWRPSETTSSNIRSIVYAAQESFGDLIDSAGSIEEIRDLLIDVAEAAREAAESATESADNMEDGFGHETYQSEELRGRAEALESWADELDSWEPDADPDEIDEVDEEAIRDEIADGFAAEEGEDAAVALAAAVAEAVALAEEDREGEVEQAIQDARDSAIDLVGQSPE